MNSLFRYLSLVKNSAPDKGLSTYGNANIQNPPREVRLGGEGKLGAAALAFVAVIFVSICLSLADFGSPNHSINQFAAIAIALFFAAAAIILMSKGLNNRSLLKVGACSVGKVISQRSISGGRRKKIEIVYEFPVGGHKPMIGRGMDRTKSYIVNSPVLVFYNPDDISNHVVICGTAWLVGIQDGYFYEP